VGVRDEALIVLNIPVYLFLGWLAFDNKQGAADTFIETLVALVKMILVPYQVRVLLNMDTEGSWGLLPTAGFLLACGFVVWGEYALIVRFLLPGA
jgi:hypothetical protein